MEIKNYYKIVLMIVCFISCTTKKGANTTTINTHNKSTLIEVLNSLIETTDKSIIENFSVAISFETGFGDMSNKTAVTYWTRSENQRLTFEEKRLLSKMIRSEQSIDIVPFAELNEESRSTLSSFNKSAEEAYRLNFIKFATDENKENAVLIYGETYETKGDEVYLTGGCEQIVFFEKKMGKWHSTKYLSLMEY